jgi:CheY-like chemotaxis protein
LVLLDLTMPGLEGQEVFRQIRHLRPEVPVVLMSGYNEQEAVAHFTGKNLAGFLQKPFTLEELAHRLPHRE